VFLNSSRHRNKTVLQARQFEARKLACRERKEGLPLLLGGAHLTGDTLSDNAEPGRRQAAALQMFRVVR
jgi:hypothetical protein